MIALELLELRLPERKKIILGKLYNILIVGAHEDEVICVKDGPTDVMELLTDAQNGSAEVVVGQIGLRRWARLFDFIGREEVA